MKETIKRGIRRLLSPLFAGEGGIAKSKQPTVEVKEEQELKPLPCNFYSEF